MRQAPCPHFLDAFSDFVDDRLPTERRMELQVHLDACEGCLKHLAAYRRGVMVYRALDAEEIDRLEPGGLFEAVERRLWLEGHLGPGEGDGSEPKPKPTPKRGGHALRALGFASAAALAFVLVRGEIPTDANTAPADPSPPVVATSTASASTTPVRIASVPIDVPSEIDAGAYRETSRTPPRRSTSDTAPVRVASAGGVDPAELVVEQRLADMQARLRRMTWETPVSVTDGWNRPRIGGAPIVRTVSYSPASYTPAGARSPGVAAPWTVEAALVVP